MNSFQRISIAFLLLLLAFPASGFGWQSKQPNVVIVITDDQGYGDLSCHGNPVVKTPMLDALASESVRLTDYHVSPTCSPTRAALMTGHWTNRTGVWHTIMGRSMLRENEVTIADVFKDSGYATGMFGKWHLGDNLPFRPEDRGFTEVLRHGGGGVGQTPDYWDNAYFDGSYWHNSKPVPVKGFCTDVFFDYAKKFIKTQKEAGKPFFAYISTNAPHGPMHCPEEYSKPYSDQKEGLANFLGMIANIDHNVGELRKMIDEEGLTDNTIFIFTTDNGTSSGANVHNSGMRGKKGSEYDGGHRVPFFVHWPKGELNKGRDVKHLTAHVDVLPTLIDLCGLNAPKDVKFDGTSIRKLLESKSEIDWPDRMLITDSQRVKDPIKWRKSSVMSQDWRLINGKELYDMSKDPGQKNNIADKHPERVANMKQFYEDWWADLKPSFSQDARIYIGDPGENPVRLTSHDWITTKMTPWNQQQVRSAMNGDANTGFWNLKVVETGEYRIRLRRWPEESGLAIGAKLAPGAPVPGVRAFREQPGVAIKPSIARLKIGDESYTTKCSSKEEELVFKVKIEKGETRMAATFEHGDGTIWGAYYAYVEKLK